MRIRSVAQPSEVQEPIERLRAGVLFKACGIVNVRAIQHNLDWVWPYWLERRFDPSDLSRSPLRLVPGVSKFPVATGQSE